MFVQEGLNLHMQAQLSNPGTWTCMTASWEYEVWAIPSSECQVCQQSTSFCPGGDSLNQTIIFPKIDLDDLHWFTNGYMGKE